MLRATADAGTVRSGLLIREPWISLILRGEKTWEMRKTTTSKRGWIALIASQSGAVQGVAQLVDCLPPIRLENYHKHFERHRIPAAEVSFDDSYTVPWVMAHARRLPEPVLYRHPPGAVIWVTLAPDVVAAIDRQLAVGIKY
jgi:hypothetical protein